VKSSVSVFDDVNCELGEGPLWHPLRQSLFWFDILGQKLYEKSEVIYQHWAMNEVTSALGWVDEQTLMIVSETGFYRFDLDSGEKTLLASLEADQPETRSNDGRADPWGGFWIGTMGKQAQSKAGAFYRYYKGEVRQIVGGITIANACCFDKQRNCAYYTDTVEQIIWKQPLDPKEGWPQGERTVFLDLREDALNPDGAVIDQKGCLWVAQWGAGQVACYSPEGVLLGTVPIPTDQPTCPAFGGEDFDVLYITTAYEHMDDVTRLKQPAGQVFKTVVTLADDTRAIGQAEPRVLLP